MKKAKVIGRIDRKVLKSRLIHERDRKFAKPLTFSLGSLLKAKGL